MTLGQEMEADLFYYIQARMGESIQFSVSLEKQPHKQQIPFYTTTMTLDLLHFTEICTAVCCPARRGCSKKVYRFLAFFSEIAC